MYQLNKDYISQINFTLDVHTSIHIDYDFFHTNNGFSVVRKSDGEIYSSKNSVPIDISIYLAYPNNFHFFSLITYADDQIIVVTVYRTLSATDSIVVVFVNDQETPKVYNKYTQTDILDCITKLKDAYKEFNDLRDSITEMEEGDIQSTNIHINNLITEFKKCYGNNVSFKTIEEINNQVIQKINIQEKKIMEKFIEMIVPEYRLEIGKIREAINKMQNYLIIYRLIQNVSTQLFSNKNIIDNLQKENSRLEKINKNFLDISIQTLKDMDVIKTSHDALKRDFDEIKSDYELKKYYYDNLMSYLNSIEKQEENEQ